jgi:hypothetical protein
MICIYHHQSPLQRSWKSRETEHLGFLNSVCRIARFRLCGFDLLSSSLMLVPLLPIWSSLAIYLPSLRNTHSPTLYLEAKLPLCHIALLASSSAFLHRISYLGVSSNCISVSYKDHFCFDPLFSPIQHFGSTLPFLLQPAFRSSISAFLPCIAVSSNTLW